MLKDMRGPNPVHASFSFGFKKAIQHFAAFGFERSAVRRAEMRKCRIFRNSINAARAALIRVGRAVNEP